jgi:iron complex outermembrane receptor protein
VPTSDDGLSLPGAAVSIPALNLSTTTDNEGRYQLTIPAARLKGADTVELRVSFAGLPTRTVRIKLAPGPITQDFAIGLAFHEEVTVGSRVAGAAAERAVPVDIVTAEQIASTGASETNQIIQALAPSFNFPRPTITDGTDQCVRRRCAARTRSNFLLINGKRRHIGALVHVNGSIGRGSTGVDLNAIPASAIQRIEILRDGAAAQYGSDAIAGVINIVLKSGVSPLTVSAKGGMTTHEDGELLDTSASYGWNVRGGSLFATVEYRDRRDTNRAGPDPRDQIVAGDAASNTVAQPNFRGEIRTRGTMTFANVGPSGQTETNTFMRSAGSAAARARTAGSSAARSRTRTGRRFTRRVFCRSSNRRSSIHR